MRENSKNLLRSEATLAPVVFACAFAVLYVGWALLVGAPMWGAVIAAAVPLALHVPFLRGRWSLQEELGFLMLALVLFCVALIIFATFVSPNFRALFAQLGGPHL